MYSALPLFNQIKILDTDIIKQACSGWVHGRGVCGVVEPEHIATSRFIQMQLNGDENVGGISCFYWVPLNLQLVK